MKQVIISVSVPDDVSVESIRTLLWSNISAGDSRIKLFIDDVMTKVMWADDVCKCDIASRGRKWLSDSEVDEAVTESLSVATKTLIYNQLSSEIAYRRLMKESIDRINKWEELL
jgi:hypothetical protein